MTGVSSRLLIAASLLLLGSAAQAVPTLSFSVDGGATTTCADGATCDLNPLAGAVTTSQTLGAFRINLTTGSTRPTLSYPLLIDLSSIDVDTSTGSHTLVIEFSDTGFVAQGSRLIGNFSGLLTGPAGSTGTASAFLDPGNTLFAKTTPIGADLVVVPGGFASNFTGAGPGATPYSLTEKLSLAFTGRGSFAGDFLLAVPEPITPALAALGLIGLFFGRRQRG